MNVAGERGQGRCAGRRAADHGEPGHARPGQVAVWDRGQPDRPEAAPDQACL